MWLSLIAIPQSAGAIYACSSRGPTKTTLIKYQSGVPHFRTLASRSNRFIKEPDEWRCLYRQVTQETSFIWGADRSSTRVSETLQTQLYRDETQLYRPRKQSERFSQIRQLRALFVKRLRGCARDWNAHWVQTKRLYLELRTTEYNVHWSQGLRRIEWILTWATPTGAIDAANSEHKHGT